MKNYDYKKLKNISLFIGLCTEDIHTITEFLDGKIKYCRAGEIIFYEGSPVKYTGVVIKGRIQMIHEDYGGNRNVLLSVHEQKTFGEIFLYGKCNTYPVSIMASEDSEILLLDLKKAAKISGISIEAEMTLRENILTAMAENSLLLYNKIDIMSKRTTKEKLMAFLIKESEAYDSLEFDIAFDRQTLADYLGVDRSAMSTEISRLQKEGRIDVHKRHFKILK
ncbi:MAG: Crp/Fnr family transcriptional regulator [Oscillospiraceae bacterium]|nr:Crp/Fnr family transcriptional regulator [Oscillospiraceae bacterium]